MNLMQMSFCGSVLILVTVILRSLLIHQLPKKTFMVLWMVALFRLLVPVALPSPASIYTLVQRNEPMQERIDNHSKTGNMVLTNGSIIEGVSGLAKGDLSEVRDTDTVYRAEAVRGDVSQNSGSVLFSFARILYFAGVLICLGFFGFTYFRCYREFSTSLPAVEERLRKWYAAHPMLRPLSVRQSDRIEAPLSYGILRPVILMPKRTDWEDGETLAYVLEHEYVHIRRYDGLIKLVMVAALCLHWFNPLVWVMYILVNRDMELSCDETVVHRFGEKAKASYAMTLIQMEEKKSGLTPLCNSFSKNAIEERITAIMKIKKNSVSALLVAAMLTVGVGSTFATSAAPESTNKTDTTSQLKENDRTDITGELPENDSEIRMESFTDFDDSRNMWEEILAPYEPFGLIWEYHPDESGNGLKMYFNGKEVRGIFDENNGVWITEHTGNSTYGTDAIELYTIYTNGVLSGLRQASEEEEKKWNVGRRATSVVADIVSQILQDVADKTAYRNVEDFLAEVIGEVKDRVPEALAEEFGGAVSDELLKEVSNQIWEELDLDELAKIWEELDGELEDQMEEAEEVWDYDLEVAEEDWLPELETENGSDQNADEADYESLLVLKTPDYEKQSVQEFNQALLDWGNENFERHERIFEDIFNNDYSDYLSQEEQNFLELTCVLSNEENFRMIVSSLEKPKTSGEYGGIFLSKALEGETEGLAWCDLWYLLNYHIADNKHLTIGERDRCIRGVMEEIKSFWDQTDLETLIAMTKDEMAARIGEIAEKHSNDLIKIVIPADQVSFEVMDEREELRREAEIQ